MPGSDPMPGMGPPSPSPPMPPEAMASIIFLACSKRSTSSLTAWTVVPDPLAIRLRREPLRMDRSLRSAGVMEHTIASMRSTSRSSKLSRASRICPMPGIMPRSFFMEPILRIWRSWPRKSSRVKVPLASLAAASSASWRSRVRSACSMRVSRSPMSRMREAMRSAWKRSKSVRPSPVEENRTGAPVTPRTDRAAPPRASPSSLERTTPVKPTPSRKATEVLTAS